MENQSGILLDSGTNEVEFLEFLIGNTSFGINVLKVREIIKPCPITKIPHSHKNVEGIIELRGEVLPVIHLRRALEIKEENAHTEEKFIVSEFNGLKVILLVDHVTQIHRLTWADMEKPSTLTNGMEDHLTGVIKQENNMILLLDVEKVLFDIYPNMSQQAFNGNEDNKSLRVKKKIMIVEDSPMLRKLIEEMLISSGFQQLVFYENGKDAWDYLSSEVKNDKQVDLIITDIEMPQMDGHHLTRKIKEDSILSKIPVIIFSSLITEHLKHKGEMVGADAQISKPQLSSLIETMDLYLFNN
ncbi:chemotaxis protein [Sutcliffiella rhizosphaerae]|uniref:Chemotaxis protein CheV n=1 Tax=Sutcliffiella rhizosphaerae TaxID=2880967 RepID=A0ABN8A484_9BACI|nr:chemotaxis protein [Sutcliffiella rhizosphaerae]CAG9619918.1 Chemotaxis protein CheV [Sutcliffiella rhizosphaerae]